MTDDMMNLRTVVEKTPEADLLREMIGFAAQRLMELKIESQTDAAYGEKNPNAWPSATVTATGSGRPVPARSSCAPPSCARAPTSRASGRLAGWPRRRSPPWCRRVMCRALDPLGRRSGTGHGHDRHLHEPGQPSSSSNVLGKGGRLVKLNILGGQLLVLDMIPCQY